MVIDNAFDDNVKIVFDLTNQAPLTRQGTNILAVDDHLESIRLLSNEPKP